MGFNELLDRWEEFSDIEFFMPAYENLGKQKEELDYQIVKSKIYNMGFPISENRIYSVLLENGTTYYIGHKYNNETIPMILESKSDILIVTPSRGFIKSDEPLIFRGYEVKTVVYFREPNSSESIK